MQNNNLSKNHKTPKTFEIPMHSNQTRFTKENDT